MRDTSLVTKLQEKTRERCRACSDERGTCAFAKRACGRTCAFLPVRACACVRVPKQSGKVGFFFQIENLYCLLDIEIGGSSFHAGRSAPQFSTPYLSTVFVDKKKD